MKKLLENLDQDYNSKRPANRLDDFCPRKCLLNFFTPIFRCGEEVASKKKAVKRLQSSINTRVVNVQFEINEYINQLSKKIYATRSIELDNKLRDIELFLTENRFNQGNATLQVQNQFSAVSWQTQQPAEILSKMFSYNRLRNSALNYAKLLDRMEVCLCRDAGVSATYDDEYADLLNSSAVIHKIQYPRVRALLQEKQQLLAKNLQTFNLNCLNKIKEKCHDDLKKIENKLGQAKVIMDTKGVSVNQRAQTVLENVKIQLDSARLTLLKLSDRLHSVTDVEIGTVDFQKTAITYTAEMDAVKRDLVTTCQKNQNDLDTKQPVMRKIWDWLRSVISIGRVKSRRYKASQLLSDSLSIFADRDTVPALRTVALSCAA